MSRHTTEAHDIVVVLLKHKSLSIHELMYHLAVDKKEEQEFKKLLKKMVTAKEIKISTDHLVTLAKPNRLCVYHANKDARGGVATDPHSKQMYFIHPEHENFAIDGDEVTVAPCGADKEGRPLAEVKEIIKHKLTNLVGRVEQYKDKYYLISDNHKLGNYPVVIETTSQIPDLDSIYSVVIVSYPNIKEAYFRVNITANLGHAGDDEVFVNRVLIESGAPIEFSEEAV